MLTASIDMVPQEPRVARKQTELILDLGECSYVYPPLDRIHTCVFLTPGFPCLDSWRLDFQSRRPTFNEQWTGEIESIGALYRQGREIFRKRNSVLH